MNKIEQERRRKIWMDYLYSNSATLVTFASKYGFYPERVEDIKDDERQKKYKNFVLTETFSRIIAYKAIRNRYKDNEIRMMPLYHHFDLLLINDEGDPQRFESKFRLNDKDEYPTDNVSMKKKDFLKATDEDTPMDLCYSFWNGGVVGYDLFGEYNEEEWSHSATTANGGKIITEFCLAFDPKDRIWETTVSLPYELYQ